MSLYVQSDRKLTEEEKLLAEVIGVSERIPCGFQIGMPLHLDRAIAQVEALFTEHKLPLKDELIGELTLWRVHAEQGLGFSQQCDQLMHKVMRLVESARNIDYGAQP
jgi:hypothetical protein